MDDSTSIQAADKEQYTLKELCGLLSISTATGRNWIKLGKIVPAEHTEKKPFFSRKYVEEAVAELRNGNNKSLKSRRNKKHISGNGIYRLYIAADSANLTLVEKLAESLTKHAITPGQMGAVLAECALQVWYQASGKGVQPGWGMLTAYAAGELEPEEYLSLIEELLMECGVQKEDAALLCEMPETEFIFEKNVDVLGLLYLSLRNMGNRKVSGAYYTPTSVVEKVIDNLMESNAIDKDSTILDPCCGTGNFLLQLPDEFSMEHIYGTDIDRVSICLARINMALKFQEVSVSVIKRQVRMRDFLLDEDTKAYQCILGNPPWGAHFTEDTMGVLRKKYVSADNNNPESYDVFLEQSLRQVEVGGKVAFVLPEAVLSVKAHSRIRQVLLQKTNIEQIDYLGEVFDHVQCPSILLQLKKTEKPLTVKGMRIAYQDEVFQIQTERKADEVNFNFHIKDEDYRILEKIEARKDTVYLKNQADFALGIVTGDNKRHVTGEKTEENEVVLKGSDIFRYGIRETKHYLKFQSERFQQTAPEVYYRAEEKLLYRFIGGQLIFAYDDRQRISLNSCNLVIPHRKDMDMRYIMAVLNSRMAQFVFNRKFRSVKVLRQHVEQIPIPMISWKKQQQLVHLAKELEVCKITGKRLVLYNQVDRQIAKLFGLKEEEYGRIVQQTNQKSLFL